MELAGGQRSHAQYIWPWPCSLAATFMYIVMMLCEHRIMGDPWVSKVTTRSTCYIYYLLQIQKESSGVLRSMNNQVTRSYSFLLISFSCTSQSVIWKRRQKEKRGETGQLVLCFPFSPLLKLRVFIGFASIKRINKTLVKCVHFCCYDKNKGHRPPGALKHKLWNFSDSARVQCYLKLLKIIFKTFFLSESCSVVSDSRAHELYSPWNSPDQDTGVGSCCLLQGIFPTQGSNPDLPYCRQFLYQLSQQGNLKNKVLI